MHVNRCCNSWRQKCEQERSREYFQIYRPHNRNSAHVERESRSDTSNNRGDWNRFKIIQTVPEQRTRKARNYGTAKKKIHIRHCTHTAECANVKVQNIFHGLNNVTCSTNCKYRTAATLYTLETWLFQAYNF